MPPITLLIGTLALALAASTSTPDAGQIPGEIEVFKDWAVGCDNGGDCQATSLLPGVDGAIDNGRFDDDWGGPITLVRSAGDNDVVKIRGLIQADEIDRYRMKVDGRLVDTGAVVKGDFPIEIIGEDAKKVASAIASGHQLEILGPDDQILTKISLAGSSAALRYIDTKQKRARTPTALVAKGRRTFKPAEFTIPVIAIRQWDKADRIPATGDIVALVESSECKNDRFGVVEDQVFPLGQKDGVYRALVLISCGSGAYNFSSRPYIGEISGDEKDGASWTFTTAEFDRQPSWGGEGTTPLLVNAYWIEDSQILGSYGKGRGLGDCGSAEKYVWDGARFRLIEASGMNQCRGAYEWITTWRAKYLPPDQIQD